MSTPSTSSLYFKCLYADVHVKLSAGVDVAVGQKTATVQMQLDACFNCAPLKPISDFKTSPPGETTKKKKRGILTVLQVAWSWLKVLVAVARA